MRLVAFLSIVSVGLFLTWLIEPDIWLLTLALFATAGAAVRGIVCLSVEHDLHNFPAFKWIVSNEFRLATGA